MTIFNKTEAAIFPMQSMLPEDFTCSQINFIFQLQSQTNTANSASFHAFLGVVEVVWFPSRPVDEVHGGEVRPSVSIQTMT